MIREVDLVMYLPPFMRDYKETVATLEAENPEFHIVWDAVNRVLYSHFISTADEYGISRFERLLGIFPSSEDTLESRRSRVQSKWFNTIPYTMKVLLQKLTVLCGNTSFSLKNNFTEGYTLTMNTNLELYGQVEELEYIINTMIPENIVVVSLNSIPCDAEGAVFFGGGICFVNSFQITNDFIESYDVQGSALIGGGTVHTDFVQISTDSIEQHNATGAVIFGGAIVETAQITITTDFSEIMRADGDALAASGIVQVDFIEVKQD